MANYTGDYTAEQIGTIEFLISEGKKVNQQKQDILRFESYDQKEVDKLDEKLDEIRSNLDEALNAKPQYDECIRIAKLYLGKAEMLKKKYGVGK